MASDLVELRRVFANDGSASAGTALGSSATMLTTTPRQRDRRQAIPALLSALARALDRRHDVSLIRGVFEQTLRQVVPLRTVQLREAGSRWLTRPESVSGPESVALAVRGPDASNPGVLEATFDPGCPLGEWHFQTLGLAADIGALVLAVERSQLQLARAGLRNQPRAQPDSAAPLIGSTTAMVALRSTVERVAATDFIVLLEGESGVGKELVARKIHELSRRSGGPFVAVNCAAIVETLLEAELFGIEDHTATGVRGRRGKFDAADGGTLFLDEVADLSLSAQAKLLRAIQDLAVERVGGHGTRRVDTRIIVASNRSLAALVGQDRFRLDLYYRLNGIDIHVPALRERREDVLELARYFLERHRTFRPLSLSAAATDALLAYDWPGNVRELERVIERAVALAAGRCLELEDLPPALLGGYTEALVPAVRDRLSMRAWGSRYARLVLERCSNNKRMACRELGISYHTLQGYLRFRPEKGRSATARDDPN